MRIASSPGGYVPQEDTPTECGRKSSECEIRRAAKDSLTTTRELINLSRRLSSAEEKNPIWRIVYMCLEELASQFCFFCPFGGGGRRSGEADTHELFHKVSSLLRTNHNTLTNCLWTGPCSRVDVACPSGPLTTLMTLLWMFYMWICPKLRDLQLGFQFVIQVAFEVAVQVVGQVLSICYTISVILFPIYTESFVSTA